MDTHQLEVFIAAAQHSNFTKASRQLNMVPSAVSHSISMLENELHVKLFARDNNRIALTEAGQDFLRDAIRITTIANNAIVRTESEKKEALQIGFVFPEFICQYIPLMTAFCENHKSVEVLYMQHDSITIAKMLSEKKLDVAFGRKDMFSMEPDIIWKKLYRDPFFVVMHQAHRLASEESVTIPMLQHEKILVMNRSANPGMFDMIQHLFLSHHMMPNLHDYSNNHLTTLILAAMKVGVVIIPNLNICYRKLPQELVCKKLEDENAFHEIGIAWNVENMSSLLSDFLSMFEK